MPTTTTHEIDYPDGTSAITPLESHFEALAVSADEALTALKANIRGANSTETIASLAADIADIQADIAKTIPLAVFDKSTAQTIAETGGTPVKVTFDVQTKLKGGISYSGGDFTLPKTGFYSVSTWLNYDNDPDGRRYVSIMKNGVSYMADNRDAPNNGNGNIVISSLIYATANDIIYIGTIQDSGASLSLTDASIHIFYLGDQL